MNDYQKREHEKAAEFRKEAALICAALGWEMVPARVDPDHNAPRGCSFKNGKFQIFAVADWKNAERVEFSANAWPTHTDKDGKECRVSPHSLGSEWVNNAFVDRETGPKTTAARSRTPEAIAKQIKTKVIPEYLRIYEVLQEYCDSHQAYADKEADIIGRLFAACQDTPHQEGAKPRTVRNIPGEGIWLDYRGPGSIKIDLSAEDMIDVIEFLREKRAEK